MPSLTIVSSDRPATLIERLALDLGEAPLGPFATETIVVQSRGTERWVRHELATRHGCAAGLTFPFAASFFRKLSAALLPDGVSCDEALSGAATKSADLLEGDSITWRILELLEFGIVSEPDFEPLRAFVGTADQHDTRKLLGLAGTAAARFEEYQLYRPELFLSWESEGQEGKSENPHERWQRALWRRLIATSTPMDHVARFYIEAADLLNAEGYSPTCLPQRLSVFGVNTLPPAFVRLLHAIARHIPSGSTSRLPRARAGLRRARRIPSGPVSVESPGSSSPCWRRTLPIRRCWAEHHSAEATDATILARLQADIRQGIERGPRTGLAEPVKISDRDVSLAVHHCHSPMREMEVLRDQLLAAFAADPTLRPHDVLLLLPDVATYGPFVETVFGIGEQPHIPHHIADRPITVDSRLAVQVHPNSRSP